MISDFYTLRVISSIWDKVNIWTRKSLRWCPSVWWHQLDLICFASLPARCSNITNTGQWKLAERWWIMIVYNYFMLFLCPFPLFFLMPEKLEEMKLCLEPWGEAIYWAQHHHPINPRLSVHLSWETRINSALINLGHFRTSSLNHFSLKSSKNNVMGTHFWNGKKCLISGMKLGNIYKKNFNNNSFWLSNIVS